MIMAMNVKIVRLSLILTSFYPAVTQSQFTPIVYSNPGSIYSQNFDSLPASGTFTLPGKGPYALQAAPFHLLSNSGWFFVQTAGTANQAAFNIGAGTATAHGIYSTGSGNSSERSLGSLSSSGGSYAFGVMLRNQTGKILNNISIQSRIEQWRKGGSGKKNTWICKIKTGKWDGMDTSGWVNFPEGNFSSILFSNGISALNGNLPEHQLNLSFQLTQLKWKPGELLLIAWLDPDEAGNDDLCAIDQFQFSAIHQASVPSIGLIRLDSISPYQAYVSCPISPGNANTQVEWEWDTIPSFDFPENLPAVPAIIEEHADTITTKGTLTRLAPGKKYFIRLTASNFLGSTISQVFSCTTPNLPPLVFTLTPTLLDTQKIEVGISYQLRGGNLPIEMGVKWATKADFTNAVTVRSDFNSASQLKLVINKLPPASLIYVRAYARHLEGISYGNTQIITTPTSITQFKLSGKNERNDSSISYVLETAAPIQYLSANDFTVLSNQIKNAKVIDINGSGKNYTIMVTTGTGDGTIELQLNSKNNCYPPIAYTPSIASGICKIDKTPPQIKRVYYTDKPYKVGDTIQLIIEVARDSSLLQLLELQWSSLNMLSWKKINDSVYFSDARIPEGMQDIPPRDPIPISLEIIDAAGNRSGQFRDTLTYSQDRVDANSPSIIEVTQPKSGWYAIGDTLTWSITYSEPIILEKNSRNPYLSIQMGKNTKQAIAYLIKENTLFFRYLIKQGDFDSTGISWKKNILLNGTSLSDSAGNLAQLSWIENIPSALIKIDGIAPTISQITAPSAGWYKKSDWLFYTVIFNKTIQIKGDTSLVNLLLSIQSNNQSAQLIKMKDNQLVFGYQVPEGCWDKKGVYPIGITVGNGTTLFDWLGNPANINGNFSESNTGIFLDGTAPEWVNAKSTPLEFCLSDSIFSIRNPLAFLDKEPNEKVTITIEGYSGKDSLLLDRKELISTGSLLQPKLSILTRNRNIPRKDTLIIKISDSLYSSTTTIYVEFLPAITNNSIQPIPIQCAGSLLPTIQASHPSGGNSSYNFQWESANNPATKFIQTAPGDTLPTLSMAPLQASIWIRRKVISGSCIHFSNPVLLPVTTAGLWLGRNSSDWNEPANWCGEKLPTSEISIMIPGGTPFKPILSNKGFCDSLQIINKGVLLVLGELAIHGSVQTPAEAIVAERGTLRMNGESPQTISGLNFNKHGIENLLIQNKKGVTIADSLVISRQLAIQQGHILTNSELWMNAGASISACAEGTYMSGKVNTRWRIPTTKRQYLLSSHPFSTKQTLQQLANQVDITGNTYLDSLFAVTPLQLPSAFKLPDFANDSAGIGQLNWLPFTSVSGKNNTYWNPLQGIRWLFRGNKGQALDDQTDWLQDAGSPIEPKELLFSGEVNMGNQSIQFPDTAARYQLMGNPYLCSIDMSKLSLSDSIAPVFWKWNPQQGKSGGFTCQLFSKGDVLPAFDAFLIRLQGKNEHQIIFSEQGKVMGTSVASDYAFIENVQQMTWQLWQDSIFYDQIIIRENPRASNGFDWLDGEKIMNPSHNIYTRTYQGQALSIDQRKIDNRSFIPIELSKIPPGNYALKLSNATLHPANKLLLVDNYSKQQYLLGKDTVYTFVVTSDTLANRQPRFLITSQDEYVFRSNRYEVQSLLIWPLPARDVIQMKSASWPAGEMTISIFDFSGKLVKRIAQKVQLGNPVQLYVTDILPGNYTIEITQVLTQFRAVGKWIKQ